MEFHSLGMEVVDKIHRCQHIIKIFSRKPENEMRGNFYPPGMKNVKSLLILSCSMASVDPPESCVMSTLQPQFYPDIKIIIFIGS